MRTITSEKHLEEGLAKLLQAHPHLVPVSQKAGRLPLRLQKGGFGGLARIVIGQQVSRASAQAIHTRFAEMIVPQDPKRFLEAGPEVWRQIGLSRPKQNTLEALAVSVLAGELPIERLAEMPADEAMSRLTAIKGIGSWTAEVYLLFCTGHPDIFPAGDLALQHAVGEALNQGKRNTEKELREISLNWSPHRGIAARLFWAYYKSVREGRGALPV